MERTTRRVRVARCQKGDVIDTRLSKLAAGQMGLSAETVLAGLCCWSDALSYRLGLSLLPDYVSTLARFRMDCLSRGSRQRTIGSAVGCSDSRIDGSGGSMP